MRRFATLVGLMTMMCGWALAEAPANLVKNGSFADAGSNNAPAVWKLQSPGLDVTIDKAEHPKDIPTALKVAIKTATGSQGSLNQVVKVPGQKAKYKLEAQLKGTAPRLGYVQVKLKKQGKEIAREKTPWNGLEWEAAKIEFDSQEADELSIECRISQSEKSKDQTVWFAAVSLTEVK